MPGQESIASSGFPLGFKVRAGSTRPAFFAGAEGRDTIKVEARHFPHNHQKEAVVAESAAGSSWRMVSDEGVHIKGDDLAPFPLGFYNAGLQADLAGRLLTEAETRAAEFEDLRLQCITGYSMTGSFLRGDGMGAAVPATIKISLRSRASAAEVAQIVAAAVQSSPALATMRQPVENTFALYVNGKRCAVATMPDAGGADAADPLKTYNKPPAPLATGTADIIVKTGEKRPGTPAPSAPASQPGAPIVREVEGNCAVNADGMTTTDVALQLPGMSHFALRSDESARDCAPSGLALLSAGIAFCYMTQLSRYIDYMKLAIRHVRLVQMNPYACEGTLGSIAPVTTHLFLHGEENPETHEKLMRIAANTCFLHATLKAALSPRISIVLNGAEIQ